MTGSWVAMNVQLTHNPGRCPSILATTTAEVLSSMTSGSSLLPTAGKSMYYVLCRLLYPIWNSKYHFAVCLCFSPYTQIAILGDHHIWVNEGTEQYMSVDAIYWHESYDYRTLDYDIMLMKLAHPVTQNQYVKPVALPKSCPTPGDMCTVSGWGNIYSDDGEIVQRFKDLTLYG